MHSPFIPIPLILSKIYSLTPKVLVAQWIARWTSNPDIAGSNPAEDDSGFRCFTLFQKFTSIENCLCFTQKRIQMSDNGISSSERPKNYATKKEQWKMLLERKHKTRKRNCNVLPFIQTLCRWQTLLDNWRYQFEGSKSEDHIRSFRAQRNK